jgi:hypothetical protein
LVFGSAQNSPACWSRQFEEGDRECRRCDYNVSCRDAFARSNGMPQMPQMAVPQMPNPYLTPSAQPNRIPVPPPQLHPSIPQAPAMMQQVQQVPMMQPGMPAQQQTMQEYTPYPGESIPERVAKNITLGMLSAFFNIFGNQMARVFQLWRWPPPNQ